jgi:hypothetical protein
MKFAYYTSFFNDETSDKTSLFCIWLYYLFKSGSFDSETDVVYIITNEETSNAITGSNLYKFIMRLLNASSWLKIINVDKPESPRQASFLKYFPPVLDIMVAEKFDYIFYCEIFNLINGNVRAKFENKEEIPTAYVMFDKNITDEVVFSYIKTTDWYNENKDTIDKLPAINSSLFCIKNGINEVALLKHIFNYVAGEHFSDSILNYTLYSHSQYMSEQCHIELKPELFFNSVEINKLDSKKEIILLRDIDWELMTDALFISLICKAEKV